jgi:iron complex transport system permease protein
VLLSKAEIEQVWEQDKRIERKRLAIVVAASVVVFLICASVRYNAAYWSDKFVPVEYAKSIITAIQLQFAHLFNTQMWYSQDSIIDSIGYVEYHGALARLRTCLMTFGAGAALAISGAIFQAAYRNPMASPNILGVSAGVNLGNVVLVLLFSTAAMEHVYLRYGLCYAFVAICVCVVIILGHFAGDRHENISVIEMVMMGAIISQAINAFVQYNMYTMADDDLALLQQIQMGVYMQVDPVSFVIFAAAMIVSIVPVVLLRYRLNVIALDRIETATIGVRAFPYRLLAQICGVIMSTAAIVHCGQIGMVAMVVPYIVRALVGSNFKNICIYSIFIGGVVVMVGQLVGSLFLIADTVVPATFVINIIGVPAFIYILIKQKGGFDVA